MVIIMLKSVHLENFKGLKNFTSDFTPITVLGGKNNCGKTSILEALFLNFSYRNLNCFSILNGLRHIVEPNTFRPERVWAPLFNNFDLSSRLIIEVLNDKDKRSKLSFQLDANFTVPQNIINGLPPAVIQNTIASNHALMFIIEYERMKESGHYIIHPNGMGLNVTESQGDLSGLFQPVFLFKYDNWFEPNMIAQWFGNLILNDKKGYIIDCLKLFDNRIKDLQIIVQNGFSYLYAFFEDGRKMPVNYMGDGMNRLMNMVMCILANHDSIILVDEVENGFHYSMYNKVWELLGKAAELNRCQIIANTHSLDMIRGAVYGLDTVGRLKDLSYIRLGRENNDIRAHVFDSEMITYALNSEMEVR